MTELAHRNDNAPANLDPFNTTMRVTRTNQLQSDDQFDRMSKWLELFMGTAEVAKVLARTNFVPEPMRGQPEDIAASMMKGLELGIDPLDALANMYVVRGKVGFSAEFMRRRVLEAGHEIVFEEQTDERCKVRGRRNGSNEWTTVVFTKAQAEKAGVQNMSKYAADMLVARASSRLCRRIFPDVLGGAQIIEDVIDGAIIDVPETQPVDSVQRKRPPRTVKATVPQSKPAVDVDDLLDEPEPVAIAAAAEEGAQDDLLAAEDDPNITAPQLRKLSILRKEHSYPDTNEGRADWFQWVESNITRTVASNKELTKAEASVLIDILENPAEGEA